MKKIAIAVIILLVFAGGFVLVRSRSGTNETELTPEPSPTRTFEPISEEVKVDFVPNSARTQAKLTISNLDAVGVDELEYEILYETEGLIKGINSGSKPIKVGPSGRIERDIDFGTCSSGICRYDKNVGKITLVIRFNTPEGTKIFKKEYL